MKPPSAFKLLCMMHNLGGIGMDQKRIGRISPIGR